MLSLGIKSRNVFTLFSSLLNLLLVFFLSLFPSLSMFFIFFVASIFLSLIFSAYVCHVTTAGSLGDQLKCDNQSNQSNQSNIVSSTRPLNRGTEARSWVGVDIVGSTTPA